MLPGVFLEAGSQTLAAKYRGEEAHRDLSWSWNGERAWDWESLAGPGKGSEARESLV